MWPTSLWMSAIAVFTELSESTSITEILMGSFSCAVFSASSGAREGLRMVAYTLWPARPRLSAVARPIPVLVPVINTDAIMCSPFAVVEGRRDYTTRWHRNDLVLDNVLLADNPPGTNCWSQHIVVERAAETPTSAHPRMELVTLVISPCPSSMRRFHKDRSREKCYISHISQSPAPF